MHMTKSSCRSENHPTSALRQSSLYCGVSLRYGSQKPSETSHKHQRFLLFTCLTLFACNASAYVDPNAGGLLLQILFPVAAAVLGWWAFLKGKIRLFAARLRRWAKQGPLPESPEDPPG